jgi:uncharacterized protein
MILAQIAVFFLIYQVVIRPIMAAFLYTRPPRMRVTFCAPEEWGVSHQDVQISSSDGVSLDGWYVPPRNGAAILLLHGLGGNRLAVSYHGETLVREGYGALMIDLRAHGSSGGRRFSRDERVIEDVLACVAYLSRQPEVEGRVGIMGISVGGMMAIQAAARSVGVRAIAVDGPVLGSIEDLPPPADALDRFWRYPLERYYQHAINWFTPQARPLPSNLAALRRIAGRPVLFMSTGTGMEQRLTFSFFEAAGDPKNWWELRNARHATGWILEPEAYGRTMIDFFNRGLQINDSQAILPQESTRREIGNVDPSQTGSPPAQPVVMAITGERTIAPPTAMILSLAVVIAGMMLFLIPYQLRWGLLIPQLPPVQPGVSLLGLMGLLILGLLLRVWLLRVACWLGSQTPVNPSSPDPTPTMTTFARCEKPMRAGTYRAILLLPLLSLALLPGLIGALVGNFTLILWGLWMLAACGADIAGLWAIRDLPSGTIVRRHPHRPGCQILESTQ